MTKRRTANAEVNELRAALDSERLRADCARQECEKLVEASNQIAAERDSAKEHLAKERASLAKARRDLAEMYRVEADRIAQLRTLRTEVATAMGHTLRTGDALDRLWISLAPAVAALPEPERVAVHAALLELTRSRVAQAEALTKAAESPAFSESMESWVQWTAANVLAVSGLAAMAVYWWLGAGRKGKPSAP